MAGLIHLELLTDFFNKIGQEATLHPLRGGRLYPLCAFTVGAEYRNTPRLPASAPLGRAAADFFLPNSF
jgi:hypothetical protein